jgi:hypothetical protein
MGAGGERRRLVVDEGPRAPRVRELKADKEIGIGAVSETVAVRGNGPLRNLRSRAASPASSPAGSDWRGHLPDRHRLAAPDQLRAADAGCASAGGRPPAPLRSCRPTLPSAGCRSGCRRERRLDRRRERRSAAGARRSSNASGWRCAPDDPGTRPRSHRGDPRVGGRLTWRLAPADRAVSSGRRGARLRGS